MRAWLATQRSWLVVERLPAYAPDLNATLLPSCAQREGVADHRRVRRERGAGAPTIQPPATTLIEAAGAMVLLKHRQPTPATAPAAPPLHSRVVQPVSHPAAPGPRKHKQPLQTLGGDLHHPHRQPVALGDQDTTLGGAKRGPPPLTHRPSREWIPGGREDVPKGRHRGGLLDAQQRLDLVRACRSDPHHARPVIGHRPSVATSDLARSFERHLQAEPTSPPRWRRGSWGPAGQYGESRMHEHGEMTTDGYGLLHLDDDCSSCELRAFRSIR
jgi:hypothetical protein